ncbi:MAG: beta-galactosidase, partial [Ruthenibacterium sp.]
MNFDVAWLCDPRVFAINRMPAHNISTETGVHNVPTTQCLDGIWKFHYAQNLKDIPSDFKENTCDVSAWDDITVPGLIQLQGDGKYGVPHYVNTMYPWDGAEKIKPGQIPADYNPVGTYVTFFEKPADWQRVLIHFGGADAALAVWCNGTFIGYAEDSFTPAEFELTAAVHAGKNRLTVQVFRFCSGSWLEDQDFWRFSGLFRTVKLFTVPALHVQDSTLRAILNDAFSVGTLALQCVMENDTPCFLTLQAFGKSCKTAAHGS